MYHLSVSGTHTQNTQHAVAAAADGGEQRENLSRTNNAIMREAEDAGAGPSILRLLMEVVSSGLMHAWMTTS
jgi:hypothetical protein